MRAYVLKSKPGNNIATNLSLTNKTATNKNAAYFRPTYKTNIHPGM